MGYADSEEAEAIRVSLGALLRRRREDADRSLAAVAEAAGISTAFLSELERGLKDVSTEKLAGIGLALDLPAADMSADLAPRLSARTAPSQPSWPHGPKMQVRMAARPVPPQAPP